MKDKVALVTGAARGIGRAIALHLAGEGADVVVADIDVEAGEGVAGQIRERGSKSIFVATDVTSVASIQAMVQAALDQFGRIDLLANNAGLTRPQGLLDVTEQDWDLIHSVNARGSFFCLQAVARHMVSRQRGRIVNTASIAALGFRDTTSIAYSASKGAVLAMTRVAAYQLAPFGVAVNAVCPGPTQTEFAVREWRREHGRGDLAPEKRHQLYASMDEFVPLGTANTPEDVANVVGFLLSERAANVTGSAYVVDGGIMLQ